MWTGISLVLSSGEIETDRDEGMFSRRKKKKENPYLHNFYWQTGLRRQNWKKWGNEELKWGTVEGKEGGFTIHLLAPGTRSIPTERRQSAHNSLHVFSLSLFSLLFSSTVCHLSPLSCCFPMCLFLWPASLHPFLADEDRRGRCVHHSSRFKLTI